MHRRRSPVLGVLSAAILLHLSLPIQCATLPSAGDLASKVSLPPIEGQPSYRRFIVRFKDGVPASTIASEAIRTVNDAAFRAGVQMPTGTGTHTQPLSASFGRTLGTGAKLVKVAHGLNRADAQRFMSQLATDPTVAYVEPDLVVRRTGLAAQTTPVPVVPNDPGFSYQWHLRPGAGSTEKIGTDTGSYANIGGSNVSNAWNLSKGDGVVVAVLDTGITAHPDLDTSLADSSYDMITDKLMSGRSSDGRAKGAWDIGDWTTGDAYLAANGGCVDSSDPAEDSSWHGSHVAGTVAELTGNALGDAGVAPNAKVLPVRVLGHCGGNMSDIADAIIWAAGGHIDGLQDNQNPAKVINMSLGGSGQCDASSNAAKAIATARALGAVVVVAAGNSSADVSGFVPASCPGVIAVASHGITGKPAFYSNYGTGITVSAPGGGVYANDTASGTAVNAGFVWSTINTGSTVPVAPTYGGAAGTSQATPHVSGTVALMLAAAKAANRPTPTPNEVASMLMATARSFPAATDHAYGAGMLDAYAATAMAAGITVGTTPAAATVLSNGKAVFIPTGDASASRSYAIFLPKAVKALTLRTYGGQGNVSLYARIGSIPNANGSDATYSSVRPGNNESITIANAGAGTYYLTVSGVTSASSYYVLASYSP